LKAEYHIKRGIIAAAILAALCGLAAACGGAAQGQSPSAWYSVVPPALAIVLAFLTHHVVISLGVAILVGGLLGAVPVAPTDAGAWAAGLGNVLTFASRTVTNPTNLLILSFIPPIFTMVEVIIASGGFRGIVLWLSRRVRSGRSAQLATALLGVICFIDDYANAIVVGSMMQPITDRFRISREKLAFLVDATSAPVSGLAVVSTWIAYEVGLFADISEQLDMGKTGYAMFFDALSFRFYCLLMLVFMFAHILTGRDFGPMRTAERQARSRGDTSAGHRLEAALASGVPGRAMNALVPLAGLVTFHLTGLWIDGGGPAELAAGGSLLSLVYWREVITSAEHSHHMLLCAALFGTILAALCGRVSGLLQLSTVPGCIWRGAKRALLPSIVLILAWSLKNCCDDLGTGQFLTGLLAGRIPPHWFPPLLFVVASVVSFATGTSWGTMAILIPTAIPIAFRLDGDTYGLVTMISLATVLDGAIFGDHCSPISDTTILSSTASSCDLVPHVRTQLPYSLLVAAAALLCAYVPSARGLSSLWSFALAAAVVVAVLRMFGRRMTTNAESVARSQAPGEERANATGDGPA
jgi:Na+/H+ antiporter NhaC